MTEITITGPNIIRTDLMPAATLARYEGLLSAGDALYDAGQTDAALAKWDEADLVAEPYREPPKPPPTAPSPPPPEIIHDRDDAIAVCTSPDVCRTLTPPVPYMVFGKGGDDQNYTGTVYSNGLIVKKADSRFTRTYGDQPGTGLGVKSGTVGDVVEPVTNSPIVRVEGIPVIRHRDSCTLNSGNCPGEYIHVQSTATHPPPDGNDEDDKTKGFFESFGDQFMKDSGTAQDVKGVWNRLGDYWDDPSQIGSDIKGAYNSLPTGAEIWQGTKDIGSGIASGAADIWNDPGAAASAAGGWIKGQAVGAWDGTVEAWEEGGVGGVLGRAAAVVGEVVSPSNKARVVRRGAEVVDDIGDAQRARRLGDENNDTTSGDDGTRSTRLFSSLRDRYLGRTPGKSSRTGREVRERMREEGTLRTNRRGQDEFLDETGTWRLVDSPQTHMGHYPVDAVDYWNNTGRYLGERSPAVRQWMLDSNNYRFEYGPLNSSRGGSTPSRYLPPVN